MNKMINFYNNQLKDFSVKFKNKKTSLELVNKFVNNDKSKISWSQDLKNKFLSRKEGNFKEGEIRSSMYRPFQEQFLYFSRHFNNSVHLIPGIFPEKDSDNYILCITGVGGNIDFSCFISNKIPDYHLQNNGQYFPLYFYDENLSKDKYQVDLFKNDNSSKYKKIDNISDEVTKIFKTKYPKIVNKINSQNIFYYVYGILSSKEYLNRFNNNLRRSLPKIPFAKDFISFMEAGKELAKINLNYELIKLFPLKIEKPNKLDIENFKIKKMTYGKKNKDIDKSVININDKIKISEIPDEVKDYIISGKSALDWILDMYQFYEDTKDSKLINDPNDLIIENNDPDYIIKLIQRIVTISVDSMKIKNSLPKIDEIN